MSSLYDQQTNDYTYKIGDSVTMGFEFVDTSGNPIDVTSYGCKFYLYDPRTKEPIPMYDANANYTKTHIDQVNGGAGVYYFGDVEFPDLVDQIESSNQTVVYLKSSDIEGLRPGVYFYAVKFQVGPIDYWVPVTGNLILERGAYGV